MGCRGADNYVSPGWYPSKQSTRKVVPTSNYKMVQVRVTPTVIDSGDWLNSRVIDFSESIEQESGLPGKVTDDPSDFIDHQPKAIVGLEIDITDIKGRLKMSQNSPPRMRGVVV